jgi:putative nucleotidyltransferase with HDIG domain
VRVADGDLGIQLKTKSNDEVAVLTDSFNVMVSSLQESKRQLLHAYDSTLEGWSKALEMRDKETEGHTLRVTKLTVDLARRLNIKDEDLVNVQRGALLHDIGKMGIPDHILLKPGKLDDQEWELMRKHPEFAFEMLWPIEYLRPALEIPYFHHEQWDGKGYPKQLRGEEIPYSARIFAVADTWDALTSDRPYKKAWKPVDALAEIKAQSGRHFDPVVVNAFIDYITEVGNLSERPVD